MGKKLVMLILVLVGVIGVCGFYVVNGTQAYTRYQQSDTATHRYCGAQSTVYICTRTPAALFTAFYPSYLATNHPLFTIEYKSSTPMTLVMTVSIVGFSEPESHSVSATNAVQVRSFLPPLLNNGQVLRTLTREVDTALHVQVSDMTGHSYYVNDIPLALHSRWLMQWVGANRLKIAAWVTPNDDAVGQVTKLAAKHLQEQQAPTPPGMIGYVRATPQQVVDQVDAIYDALQEEYHLKYLQESVPYNGAASDAIGTEYIRLPFEVLQEKSGMCIELTTLMASAVERIGLHSEVVITPGHAFLGVAITPDGKRFEYWDPAEMGRNVAAESAHLWTDTAYATAVKQRAIVDTIVIGEARNAGVGPML